MSRWFRFYSGVVDDPKAQMLSPELFKHWVNVLCIAAQHDGELPPLSVTAFMLGRIAEAKAAGILARLHAAELLDKTAKSFKPHNWDGRQYKHDASDPTNADRQKRYRDKKRNGSNGQSNGDDDVTAKRPENREQKDDRIGDAGTSAFTEGSKALSSALWKSLGFKSPLEIPLDLAGSDWRAIEWERAGWTVDLIDTQARKIGPGKPLTYYEKVFATEFAKRQAPLPIVEIKQAEKLTVKNHGTSSNPNSLIGAIDRQIAALESADGPDPALSESPVLLLSSGSIR